MISTSIRAWNVQNNKFPALFLYQNTPAGIFSFNNIDTEITEKTTPIEHLALKIADDFGKFTRVEMSALSGIAVEICQETIDDLHSQNLLKIVEFDNKILKTNVDRLIDALGEDWYTPHIQKIVKRSYLKQYQLTEEGKKAKDARLKTIRTSANLNFIITGKPFYLFYDNFDLRHDSYEIIDMDKSTVINSLQQAEKFAKITGTKPLALGTNTVYSGKEVSNTQFWISIFKNGKKLLKESKFSMYLSSQSFERWANPSWSSKLESFLPEENTVNKIVVNAMSKSYDMVEDVIIEGLSLDKDGMTWILEADLEMQKLIEAVTPQAISETRSEVRLNYPNSDWYVVILLMLKQYDDLSEVSLKLARFHANAPRVGFTLEEGFDLWKQICKEWEKDINRDEYLTVINKLTGYECLVERLPQVSNIIVDVNDVLGKGRRGTQKWSISRLQSLKSIFETSDINKYQFIAGDEIFAKVDEQDVIESWIEEGILKILELDKGEKLAEEVLKLARDKKAHYIGSDQITDKKKKEREYSRTLNFIVSHNEVKVPGLEPFYDWRQENVLAKMYVEYYE